MGGPQPTRVRPQRHRCAPCCNFMFFPWLFPYQFFLSFISLFWLCVCACTCACACRCARSPSSCSPRAKSSQTPGADPRTMGRASGKYRTISAAFPATSHRWVLFFSFLSQQSKCDFFSLNLISQGYVPYHRSEQLDCRCGILQKTSLSTLL